MSFVDLFKDLTRTLKWGCPSVLCKRSSEELDATRETKLWLLVIELEQLEQLNMSKTEQSDKLFKKSKQFLFLKAVAIFSVDAENEELEQVLFIVIETLHLEFLSKQTFLGILSLIDTG